MDRRAVWMEGAIVCAIDQRALPHQEIVLRLASYPETIQAIREMAVRGAGAIGVAGGFAMAQAASLAPSSDFWKHAEEAASQIRSARPTAKNLSYAVDRVLGAMRKAPSMEEARKVSLTEARLIDEEDAKKTRSIAQAGLSLLPKEKAVLTHCNAGWLAYGGWGTALAPLYLAQTLKREIFVYATETRPRSQGAKLTTWELAQAGIPHALIADTAVGHTMQKGEIGLVIVGADRIAANGDTANKIGTYSLAVLAKEHQIPFYVAAPSPTFDPECPSGAEIPIEERAQEEVVEASGVNPQGHPATIRVATSGVRAKNPAFDVTPARLITGFITECGVIAPHKEAIAQFLKKAGHPSGSACGAERVSSR